MKNKRISIYVRNQYLTPSSYYRIVQYANNLDGKILINNIAPTNMYKKNQQLDKSKRMIYILMSIHYYLVMLVRSTYFLLRDCINKPDYIIVSKVILPKYMPYLVNKIFEYLTRNTILYWDFDDMLFDTAEKLNKQLLTLGNNSEKIIVTSEYLKSKLKDKWKEKCLLLPTTDGDLQGFEYEELQRKRKKLFAEEVRLVWVATSCNLPHIANIINDLDIAASKIKKKFNKKLVLTVVCDKPLDVKVSTLTLNNIKWTRDVAKNEIFNAHIGIMPLIYSEFTLGKGGFKLVQYISTGLPVIASNVGFNKEVVDETCGILVDDLNSTISWTKAIMDMSQTWDLIELKGKNAHKKWNDKFSYNKNLAFWNELLN